MLGNEKDIDQLIVDLRLKGFSLKVEKNLKDFLSFQVFENIEKREMLILQPHLINKLIEKFVNEVSDKRVYGTPRFKVTRPDEGSIRLVKIYRHIFVQVLTCFYN